MLESILGWMLKAQTPTPAPAGAESLPTPAALPSPMSLPPLEVTPVGDPGMSAVQVLLIVVQIAVCVGLVACVLSKTTKNEGLGGSIMGPSQSVFRGKKSSEEKLSGVTTFLAVSFLVLSIAISFAFR